MRGGGGVGGGGSCSLSNLVPQRLWRTNSSAGTCSTRCVAKRSPLFKSKQNQLPVSIVNAPPPPSRCIPSEAEFCGPFACSMTKAHSDEKLARASVMSVN
jgi:hypothetical protein